MASVTASEMYHRFVEIIDQAAADENVYALPAAAQIAGMVGGEKAGVSGQRWDYSFTDAQGAELLVHARWWDSSKPFSIQPDIHVMRVELKGVEGAVHERRYETPLYR